MEESFLRTQLLRIRLEFTRFFRPKILLTNGREATHHLISNHGCGQRDGVYERRYNELNTPKRVRPQPPPAVPRVVAVSGGVMTIAFHGLAPGDAYLAPSADVVQPHGAAHA